MCACFKQFQTESLKLLIKELLESKGTLLGEDQFSLREFANPSVRSLGESLIGPLQIPIVVEVNHHHDLNTKRNSCVSH